jgi:hypothetical protein
VRSRRESAPPSARRRSCRAATQRFFDADLRPRAEDEDPLERERELLDFLAPDLLRPPRELFVSPACARCLFTVRAAISSARPLPRACSDSLMCSYCRFRFALLTPRGGMRSTS